VTRDSALLAAALAVALVLAAAGGCGLASSEPPPMVVVEPDRFEIRIGTFGELKAAQATPAAVPVSLNGVQRIAWLAPEGGRVKAGETIARLDDEPVSRQIRNTEDNLEQIEFQMRAKRRELDKERRGLKSQIALLETEKKNAEQFAPRDAQLFSRIEILDSEINLELIETKIEHARMRIERYVQRSEAELEIMRLQRQTESVKLHQLEQARQSLAIAAPHDGVFLRGRTWQGEHMRVGMTVWRGQNIGELPDLSRMEARVFVLESEAAGLAEDLQAEVTIDAHPDRVFGGRVKSVQPVANPLSNESPVKYFEVIVELDETDPVLMRPAARVRAKIVVDRKDEVLTVPNQAIFHGQDGTWLWVAGATGYEKRPVILGARSVSRTVVREGLSAGERVALVEPGRG